MKADDVLSCAWNPTSTINIMLENYFRRPHLQKGNVILILASGMNEVEFIKKWVTGKGHTFVSLEEGKGDPSASPNYAIYFKIE